MVRFRFATFRKLFNGRYCMYIAATVKYCNTYSHVVCVSLCEIEQVVNIMKDFDLVRCISYHEVMFANKYYFPHPSSLSFFIHLSWTFRLVISDRSVVASRDRGSLPRESSLSEATPDLPVGSGRSKIVKIASVLSIFRQGIPIVDAIAKMPFAQKAMLRRSIPMTASSPYLPNPLLPTAVIARGIKKS